MADPWVVTPGERTKHEEQFKTLRPVGGYITGEQAKGFFLQSRLPPPVLGIIWALSDVDGDGKMDLHEFSIACKLINLKLRGFTLPSTLPASLKQSACVGVGGAPAPAPAPVGPSAASGPVSTGGAAGFGIADLTACSNGLSLTSAISSGPIVSTVVVSTSVPTPAAPISAPISVPPVSAPGDSSEVSLSLAPACADAPAVISALGVATVPPCLPSSVLVTVPGTVPGLSIGPNIIPEASVNVVPGIIPVSAASCVILGVSAGAGQESVTAAVPTAVPLDTAEALAGAAPAAPLGGGVPLAGMAPIVPAQPIMPMAPVSSQAPGATVPVVPGASAPVSMSTAPLLPSGTQPMIPSSKPMVPAASQPLVAPVAPMVPQASQPLVPPASQPLVAPVAPISQPVVAAPQPPQVGGMVAPVAASSAPITAAVPPGVPVAPNGAAVQRTGSQESGGSQTPGEWAVPQASKLKFTQVFNMSDRTKSGYLSGVQARNILIQSHLPQQILAQIWALSDVDNDGRLSCEEFVLAMYLCESAKAGNKLPTVLPAELIPPTNRRQRTSSIHSAGSGGTPVGEVMGGLADNSFEDKRRENFEKGQAELERRRKALLDAQRRETEERLRREREEEAKREKARQEAERRRQEELEREMQRQREIEAQREQERKRQEDMREQARKDAELQRQQEWEKQRLQELMNVRQRQQENLLSLKAKNQSLSIEFTTKEDRVKELTQKISETRQGVTEVKATIDTMRSTRDTYMADMNQLKAAAREQNQRLLVLNQEKARLKARSTAAAGASGAEQAAVDASFTSKQMVIKQLQEKVDSLQTELSAKEEDVNNNITDLSHMKEEIRATAERCSSVFIEYSDKRKQVMTLREKLLNPDAAWGDAASSSWADKEENAVPGENKEGVMKRRALYQFDARNADEISFMPGDIIVVTMTEGVEPGWLGGVLHGQTGWFPEAYTEPLDTREAEVASESLVRTQLENIPEEAGANVGVQQSVIGEAVAVFPWRAKQRNHLSFNKGDRITVREQQEQWWYGELNNVGGWFPRSFARMVSGPAAVTSPVTTPQEAPEEPPMPDNLVHDDVSEFYQALYPYQSGEPGDLTFNAGEIILVVKKEGDWWHGVANQNTGIFPSNYVELMPNQFITSAGDKVEEQPEVAAALKDEVALGEKQAEADHQVVDNEESKEEPGQSAATPATVQTPDSANLKVNQCSDDELENKEVMELSKSPRSPKGSKGKKPEIASVLAPYDATSSNQLSLQRGQLVMIRKKTASGWWEGELQAKGKKRQIGWFPATYVKVLGGSSRSTPVSMELTNKEDAPPDLSQLSPSSGNPHTQVTVTPPTDEPMKGPNDASNGFAEQVEALYPYTAMNEDELTFEAGAIISVIDKEDAAWWKGTLEGAIGVFPSNYVQPYPSDSAANAAGTPDAEDSLCYTDYRSQGQGHGSTRSSWHVSMSSPVEQQRQSVIQEILQTEAAYLRELLLVEEVFIRTMRSSGIVNEKELDSLFVNWDELILANSYFNKALKVRCMNSSGGVITMIGDVLCQQISQLKPYLRFCSLQLHGATLLGEKCRAGGPWADLVRQCQEHPLIQGHTLTSFLLKPMQRITRYPLLIKQLLKYTPEGHPDCYNTQEALSASETLCAQVNEAVSQRENTDKLEWMQRCVTCEGLQERLVFNSLTNTLGPRKLLHTGTLHKVKSKRELVAFLLSDFLLLTTPSKSVSSCTTLATLERALTSTTCAMYRKPMFLTDLRVEGDKDSETCFTLVSPACGDIAVAAPTTHERNNWLKKIAIAKKHISDTERSLLHRQQSKEKDRNIMGRVLVTVMAGVSLSEKHCEVRERRPQGALRMHILSGAKLDSWGKGTLQSFCEVSLGSQVQRTSIAMSPHPKWDSTMQFLVKSLSEDVLCITVYEKGYFKPNEFLGRTEIKIHQVHEETRHQPGAQPQVYKLALQEAKAGEVILKISLQLFDQS
ncbi:intersectin-1-like isoform X15 [Portunus trituberculatus]|uniref:intersectin-1-like isoform X15 n=1 Tax=Portunus trituberculatus TaxID=210409 RepID=UPI001E1CB778|nr:intersectin-1-like isoform X15 [Portunus trituberculatus]